MLTLVTGVPGASKTLNTLKHLRDATAPGGEWEGRQVYYHNVKGLQLAGWIELSDQEARDWDKLPDGSIILFDEAQGIFPQRVGKEGVPAHVSPLNTHRHKGFDIFIITQGPMLVDVALRRLVGKHVHYDRRFGSTRVHRFTFERCMDDPNDYHAQQKAVKDTVTIDRSMFGVYHSAEVHTHKAKYPWKVKLAIGFAVLLPVILFVGFWWVIYGSKDDHLEEPEVSAEPVSYAAGGSPGEPAADTWAVSYVPRIEGLPHTAPAYDELTKPVAYPRPQCLVPAGSPELCRCFTQQATLMDVPVALCLSIIENGLFDPARPDTPPGAGEGGGQGAHAPAPPPASPEQRQGASGPNVYVVHDAPRSEAPGRGNSAFRSAELPDAGRSSIFDRRASQLPAYQ